MNKRRRRVGVAPGGTARRAVLAVAAAAIVAGVLLTSGGAVAVTAESDLAYQPDLTVEIVDDGSPSPSPSPSPSASPSESPAPTIPPGSQQPGGGAGSGGSGSGGAGSGGAGSGGAGGSGGGDGGSEPVAAPGTRLAFVVGGLVVEGKPAFAPLAGEAVLRVTVQNLSTETITLTADFWADNVFGLRIAELSGIRIEDLGSNERRTVEVELTEIAQNTLVHGYAEVTPPASIGGLEQKPVTREAWGLVVPWFSILVLAVAGGGYGLRRYLQFRGVP